MFIVSGGSSADWSASSVVVDPGSQIVAGVGQADVDRTSAMAQGVGGETKLHNRLLRPLLAADQPQAPAELRAALHAIDQHINGYVTRARLTQAA